MMGVVCVPEACAVYTRVYTEEEKKKRRKKKKRQKSSRQRCGHLIPAPSVSPRSYVYVRVCDSFFYFFYFNLSHFCSFSLSFFFIFITSSSHFDVSLENSPTPFICLHPTCLRLIDQLLLGRLLLHLQCYYPFY